MGCDIHLYRETKVNGVWVAADNWQPSKYHDEPGVFYVSHKDKAYVGRNYNLFGLLARGVRSEHVLSFMPRGMPHNVSEQIKKDYESWGSDAHTNSYLYLHELQDLMASIAHHVVTISGMKKTDELKVFYDSISSGDPNWQLLWPYCQWSSDQQRYTTFKVDVPATVIFRPCLAQIIDSFSSIDGDNQRIVFWFDN